MKENRLYFSPSDSGGGSKDRLVPNASQVEIGTSLYTFSDDAKKFLFPVKLADYQTAWLGLPPESDLYAPYGHDKSVIFVNDPHYNATAQFRIYKGLEILFKDNPALIHKTAFLAEGYPANQNISVQSLINQEPHPSDELIKKVLDSFLINGYMAYEWKYQHNIPIRGIEDEGLYELSRDYALLHARGGIFYRGSIQSSEEMVEKRYPQQWEGIQKARQGILSKQEMEELSEIISFGPNGEIIWTFDYGSAWSFICTARNKAMAETQLQLMRTYENPILFAGDMHMIAQGDFWFDVFGMLVNQLGTQNPFGTKARGSYTRAENRGIFHYLRDAKVGFTFWDPEKLGDLQGDAQAYYTLFQAQQDAQKHNASYEDYVQWLLDNRTVKRSTTVRPSPGAAADYVRRLQEENWEPQSRTIYEADHSKPEQKETEETIDLTTTHDEVWNALAKDSIWNQPSTYQGRDYEELRKANLGSNCPVIDDIVIDAQVATSMKTVDLTAPSYQDVDTLGSRITGYIDKLSGFTEVDWNGHHYERGVDFQDRNLEVGVPAGKATQAQLNKLRELKEYAQSKDVRLVINEVV